jgi:AcrR family transcriptional regulator
METGGRRGRPRNLARRRTIIAAATEAFARNGYDGASMHGIAEASGISDSLLYRYYSTKQALLEGIIDGVIDGIRDVEQHQTELAQRASTLRTFLREAAEIWVAYISEYLEWFSVRFTGLPIPPRRIEDLREGYDRAMNVVANRVRATGTKRDPSVVSRAFAGSIFYFLLFQARAGHEPLSLALRTIYLDELVEIYVAALQPSSASAPDGSS